MRRATTPRSERSPSPARDTRPENAYGTSGTAAAHRKSSRNRMAATRRAETPDACGTSDISRTSITTENLCKRSAPAPRFSFLSLRACVSRRFPPAGLFHSFARMILTGSTLRTASAGRMPLAGGTSNPPLPRIAARKRFASANICLSAHAFSLNRLNLRPAYAIMMSVSGSIQERSE